MAYPRGGYHDAGKGRTRYTPNRGLMALREEICRFLKRKYDLEYTAATDILVTVGGSEAIDMALRCLVGEGDEVIIRSRALCATTR